MESSGKNSEYGFNIVLEDYERLKKSLKNTLPFRFNTVSERDRQRTVTKEEKYEVRTLNAPEIRLI